jgi:dihydroxyacid dehydratase/phosphogluconate dehydratase
VTAVLSVSGSINSVKHLQAVAAEAEWGADVYRMFEDLAGRVPLLAAVRPNGEVPIEAFEDAGGARAVMKQLEPFLDRGVLTVTGRTVGRTWPASRWRARTSSARPSALGHRPTIVLIRGGDLIRIDVPARTADLDVPAAELQRRQGSLRAQVGTAERGWLSIYQRLVRLLPEGAVLRESAP